MNSRTCPNGKQPSKHEKMTCSQLHAHNDSLFAMGTNRGRLSVLDSRVSLASP